MQKDDQQINTIRVDISIGYKNFETTGEIYKFESCASDRIEIWFSFFEPEKMQSEYKDELQELLRLALVRLQQDVLDSTIVI